MNELKRLQEMVAELNISTSSNVKKEILKKYPDLQSILLLIHSNDHQFGMTSDNVIKLKDLDINDIQFTNSLTMLLTLLSLDNKITGHNAIKTVLKFISENEEYKDLILNAIDKDLKCRVSISTINKVYPGLIPTFDVALAENIDDLKENKKPNFETDNWYSSRKLDGVRCIIIVENKKAKAFSRQGKEFFTLDKVLKSIENIKCNNVIIDGEICMMENGMESYTNMMKLIKRKDYIIKNPMYNIFDMIPINDFKTKNGEITFSLRQIALLSTFNNNHYDTRYLSILAQTLVKNDEHLKELQDNAISNGWEGIMIRKDIGYEGKRSKNLLKIKMFQDAEYKVESLEMGKMRMVENGLDVERDILSAIVIKHKGFDVNVGSGWSKEQRLYYYSNPDELLGKTVTVKYFSESSNAKGGLSLRFPVIKYVHGESREV